MISTGSLLVALALLLIVSLIVLRPLLLSSASEATFAHASDPVTMRQALEAQKDALLEQIRDLDFDHETGKVPEDKYRQRRARLTAEAADILRQLETMAPAANGEGQAEIGDDAMVGDEIEAAVARLRKGPSVADAPSSSRISDEDTEAEIEAAIARLRSRPDANGAQDDGGPASSASHAPEKKSRFCSQCGEPHDDDDKFCAYCGHRLN